MELPDHIVDQVVAKYGVVGGRYRHKKTFEGKSILTGLRVYKVNLKTSIPKHVSIAGYSVKTLYTGQKEQLAQQREERKVKKETEDANEMKKNEAKIHEMPIPDSDKPAKSFLHPDREIPPDESIQATVLERFDAVIKGQETKCLKITETNEEKIVPSTTTIGEITVETRQIDTADLIAITASANFHLIPRKRFTANYSFQHLMALNYFIQFGYSKDYAMEKINTEIHPENAIDEWETWDVYTKPEIQQFAREMIHLFKGVSISLPTKL